jgi:ribosomal-protein-alanine N-acetyltransferase
MELQTKRLLLRPWVESDAEDLYEYARDPAVGPIAGWPAHTNVNGSLETIRSVLAVPETYAVCLREDRRAIGSIGLLIGERSNLPISGREGEIGYWIGVPFWGQGLIPEACDALIRHAFEDLHLETLWCGYFDGNEKSKRAQTKCHFRYHHTNRDIHWALMNDTRTEHVTRLTRQDWDARRVKAQGKP